MNRIRHHAGSVAALIQLLAGSSIAQAEIGEIIVTAERREASLQETAISMTVMDQTVLKEMGTNLLVQMGDFVPNVKMHEMPGKAGAAVSMRGFYNAETYATFDPKVAVYVDGVLIGKSTGSAFDILDLERVEILRGPQGTLYGRNTTGGAINLITRKPTDVLEGSLSVTLGGYSQRDLKGTINIPLVGANGVLSNSTDSSLNLKATLASLQRDGYWDNDFLGRDVATKDREVAHVQLQWEPSEAVSLLYAFDRTFIDEVPYPAQLVDFNSTTHPQLAPYVNDGSSSKRLADVYSFLDGEIEGHSLTLDWAINEDVSLVSITGLRMMEVDALSDSDGSPVFVLNNSAGDKMHTLSQELRLVGSAMDSRLEYVAGGFYMDEDIKDSYSANILPNFGYLESLTVADARNKVWAAFGQATYSLTERLDLTAGVRYTKENREMSRVDIRKIPAFGPPTVTPIGDAGKYFDDVSAMINLSWQWTDDLMTYAKVSKGYASGGFNPRSPTPALFGVGFEEETVYSYEVGWKSIWLDGRLLINGAVFYNDYKDLQVPVLTADARNNIGNADEANISGLEIEMRAMLTENLEVGGGYGYLDPEYETYIDPFGNDVKNNAWAHASQDSLNLYGRYVVPNFLAVGDLSFRVDWSYRSKYSLLTARNNEVSGYDFVNARIGLDEIKGPGGTMLSVAIWGKNISDELWYTSGYNLVPSLGFNGRVTAPPRSFGMDFQVAF